MSKEEPARSFAINRDPNPVTAIGINLAQSAQSRAEITRRWVERRIDMHSEADENLKITIESGSGGYKAELIRVGQYEAKIAYLDKIQLAYKDPAVRQQVWEWLCALYSTSPSADRIIIDPRIEIPTEVQRQ